MFLSKMKKQFLLYPIFFILLLVFILFLTRLFSQTQIDDISPQIPCENYLIEKSDILFIIPKFNNISIAENKTWCNYILSLNKTLALHGIYHNYNEFQENKTEEYLQEGISIFKECFGFYPSSFKPPQLAISSQNKRLIKRKLTLLLGFNQLSHKVYHCQDTGVYSNRFISLF